VRLVFAIISFVLAAVLIGYGIAQRTILAEPDEVALSTTVDTDSPVTVVDGSALNAFDGSQTLSVSGSDQVIAAYGRTTDVLAWVGDTDHNVVTFDSESGEFVTEFVSGAEDTVPDPSGSDLWLSEFAREDSLATTVNVPTDVSFLIVSDGVEPAPDSVGVTWPVDNSTPWAEPLIFAGAGFLLLGLILLLWALNHLRRGPRRKQPKMPKVPRPALYKPSRKAVSAPKGGRRAIGRGMIALPVLVVGALVLTGCSTSAKVAEAPVPSSSASAAANETPVDPPAATVRQVQRIVAEVRQTATDADAAKDADLIATRFGGAALELRLAGYAIQNADPAQPALAAIPDGKVGPILPQKTQLWPRTVFAVVQSDDTTVAPVALFLEQEDARSNYKVMYAITLEPAAVIPDLAPASVGASRLLDESPVLSKSLTDVTLGYADILALDLDSDAYLDFEAEGDSLRVNVGPAYKESVRASLPSTASASFSSALGVARPIALATNENGALAAVNLYETTTVAPTEEGAAVNPSGQVKALSGVAVSTRGVAATYGYQLLFYVPPAGGDGKIVLLGYSQGLVKAGEIG
jgi:hypothetical protein